MKTIGGYFGIELRHGSEYHSDAISINTGRNALKFILQTRGYSKIYIPFYSCAALLTPIKSLPISYSFYNINENFHPIFNFTTLKKNEAFLFINYFGLNTAVLHGIQHETPNLIVDNSQAFFEKPIQNTDTFYSVRKFFGVPDGAYFYMSSETVPDIPESFSYNRFMHLLKNTDLGAEEGYKDYKVNELDLGNEPIKKMSRLTHALLSNIDYDQIKQIRRDNYLELDKRLSHYNKLKFYLDDDSVPMVYPLLVEKSGIKQKLIDRKIFVATYWPNVLDWTRHEDWEYKVASELLALPIDQRYKTEDMKNMADALLELI